MAAARARSFEVGAPGEGRNRTAKSHVTSFGWSVGVWWLG